MCAVRCAQCVCDGAGERWELRVCGSAPECDARSAWCECAGDAMCAVRGVSVPQSVRRGVRGSVPASDGRSCVWECAGEQWCAVRVG